MMQDSTMLTALSMALFSKHNFTQPLKFAGGADMSSLLTPSEIEKSLLAINHDNITISGEIVDVCRKLGCWMKLVVSSDLELLVYTDVGNMVFPVNAIGRKAYVTGLLKNTADKVSASGFTQQLQAWSIEPHKSYAWLLPLSVTISACAGSEENVEYG